jgi:hypothetical protein
VHLNESLKRLQKGIVLTVPNKVIQFDEMVFHDFGIINEIQIGA